MMTTMLPSDLPAARAEAAWRDALGVPTALERFPLLSPNDKEVGLPGKASQLVPRREERLTEGNWGRLLSEVIDRRLATQQWIAACVTEGVRSLDEAIDVDPEIHGGAAVLKGTRFPVAQILAELTETGAITELSEEFDLDPHKVRTLFEAMSLIFQQSLRK
jgi:uncharacterized protein (DUF433 family)